MKQENLLPHIKIGKEILTVDDIEILYSIHIKVLFF